MDDDQEQPKKRVGRPPKYDWSDKRDICYKLYVEEHRSAADIARYFADHFNVPEKDLPWYGPFCVFTCAHANMVIVGKASFDSSNNGASPRLDRSCHPKTRTQYWQGSKTSGRTMLARKISSILWLKRGGS
jgi:hypothetical protein